MLKKRLFGVFTVIFGIMLASCSPLNGAWLWEYGGGTSEKYTFRGSSYERCYEIPFYETTYEKGTLSLDTKKNEITFYRTHTGNPWKPNPATGVVRAIVISGNSITFNNRTYIKN
jgi:hypothetical protein